MSLIIVCAILAQMIGNNVAVVRMSLPVRLRLRMEVPPSTHLQKLILQHNDYPLHPVIPGANDTWITRGVPAIKYWNHNSETNDWQYFRSDFTNVTHTWRNCSHTKIIIHGFSTLVNNLTHRILETQNVMKIANDGYAKLPWIPNIILVHWPYLAVGPPHYYHIAAGHVQKVGEDLGKLIITMVEKGLLYYKNTHLIGIDMGAHIAAVAGKYVQDEAGASLKRITGIDPADALFYRERPDLFLPTKPYEQWRLERGKAEIVDVVHCDSHTVGVTEDVGDIDIWVNGGRQPACANLDANYACSHIKCTRYFYKWIKRPICLKQNPTDPCQSYGGLLDIPNFGSYQYTT